MGSIFLVLGLLVIMVWAFRRFKPKAQAKLPVLRKCRWTRSGQKSGALTRFTCKTCGAVAYSGERNGPVQCKKDFGQGGL